MFEKEYLSQKMVLFVAMIFVLSFTCRSYLSEKNGMSSQEGATFAISNTSESLQDSPYNSSVYDVEQYQKNIFEEAYFFSLEIYWAISVRLLPIRKMLQSLQNLRYTATRTG